MPCLPSTLILAYIIISFWYYVGGAKPQNYLSCLYSLLPGAVQEVKSEPEKESFSINLYVPMVTIIFKNPIKRINHKELYK